MQFVKFFKQCVQLKIDIPTHTLGDGWMNGVLGHFYALSRLNWARDNLD